MRADIVGQKHVVLDRDMAREGHLVSKNIVVANRAVVRDVYADHKEVARADARSLPCATRAVQRTEFTNQIVVADLEETLFALELNVLGFTAHDRVLIKTIACAQPRKTLNNRIGCDLAIRADFNVVFNDGGWMNMHLQGFENNSCLVDPANPVYHAGRSIGITATSVR
jgi:hypothetical protein